MGIPIDVAALLADDQAEALAPGYAYSGLSSAGAVAISVRLAGVVSPVSITIEGSADEVSWSELGSLNDLVAGEDLLIDSPADRIRVSVDEGEASFLELRLRPFRSGGNGGSQPPLQVLVELATPQTIPDNTGALLVFDSGIVESHGTGLTLSLDKKNVVAAVDGNFAASLEVWFDPTNTIGRRMLGAGWSGGYFGGGTDTRPAVLNQAGNMIFSTGWTDFVAAGDSIYAGAAIAAAGAPVDVIYAGMAVVRVG